VAERTGVAVPTKSVRVEFAGLWTEMCCFLMEELASITFVALA
jgi:hypothetical protein